MSAADDPVDPPVPGPIAAESPPRWQRWLSLLFSLALLGVVVWQLAEGGLDKIPDALPRNAPFYIAIALSYFALPAFDWIIFRRLWRLPASGFLALVKKRVANDVLVNYSGEAYFYLYAKRHAQLTDAPFGAIKDVNILSALAGNLLTMILILAAWPMLGRLALTVSPDLLLGSGAIVVAVSLALILLGKRLFTLPRRWLYEIFGWHFLRILSSSALLALAWYFALPDVGLNYWLLFAALRLLIGRLPLVPSTELLFAAAAVVVAPPGGDIAPVLAMSAGLYLAANLVLGLVLSGSDVFVRSRTTDEQFRS
ncbi:hypothetical protein [Novosphingopyxis sp.]|uniref:hypothetical protein n=1 Tax=Novosphingopyxis sp. TaxID=2709690 RepID=UPI003B5A0E61